VYALSFKPMTPGEHLFQFVLRDIFLSESYSTVRALDMLGVGSRGEELSQYFVGVSAMNIVGRCIKKAQRVRDIDDESLHHAEMATFLQRVLGLANKGDDLVDQFARLSLRAAAVSGRPINRSTRQAVRQGRTEIPCYLCGIMCLDVTDEPKDEIQYEHLWPSSFGGESTADNLLPSCWACNQKKEAMLLWHTGHLFSFVLKPSPSEEELKSITRREKIARHMKTIFEYACDRGCTLKEAALEVGPFNTQGIVPIELADAMDFFNFQFS
jgi:hypothetical protein